MRTGSGTRGFTYLMLLLFVAISAAGLAAAGTQWRTTVQRERETELIYRGRAIAAAIASYRGVFPDQLQWPRSMEDLLDDRRGPQMRRHLRRLYDDPCTGKPDWQLTQTPDGGFRGVHSRCKARAYMSPSRARGSDATAPGPRFVSEHYFGLDESGAPM